MENERGTIIHRDRPRRSRSKEVKSSGERWMANGNKVSVCQAVKIQKKVEKSRFKIAKDSMVETSKKRSTAPRGPRRRKCKKVLGVGSCTDHLVVERGGGAFVGSQTTRTLLRGRKREGSTRKRGAFIRQWCKDRSEKMKSRMAGKAKGS